MTAEGKIRENAQLAADYLRRLSGLGREFGYKRQSIQGLDGFIDRRRSRPDATQESNAKLVQILGSYLGECIIHTHGGAWKQQGDQWGVFFDERNAVFPFAKVWKQFQHGHAGGDSIFGF